MPAAKTITPGDRFVRWTALEATETRIYPSGTKTHFHECRCDCGTIQFVGSYKLRIGHSRSCGCLQAEVTKKRSLKHGYAPRTDSPKIYAIWNAMLSRCTNPNTDSYEDYGARGITVCERWFKFENFLEDMGEPPAGLSIDRLDNDKGYFKENCAWRTRIDQARNRRSTVRITFDGLSLTLREWAEHLGVSHKMLRGRRFANWPVWRMLTEPKNH